MTKKELYMRAYRALRCAKGKLGIVYCTECTEVYNMACVIKKVNFNRQSNGSLKRIRIKSYQRASSNDMFSKLFAMS